MALLSTKLWNLDFTRKPILLLSSPSASSGGSGGVRSIRAVATLAASVTPTPSPFSYGMWGQPDLHLKLHHHQRTEGIDPMWVEPTYQRWS